MRFGETQSGGRSLEGDYPYGKFAVEFDRAADGRDCTIIDAAGKQVGTARIDFSEPEQSPQAKLSWAEAAQRIVHGAVGLAKLATGVGLAQQDVVNARLAICNNCPQLTNDRKCGKLLKAGKQCGCHVDKKTRVATEACPLEQW